MTEKIALITDTVANLPQDYVEENSIYVISLYVVIDDCYYKDGTEINSNEIHEKNQANPNFTSKSASPSPGDFSEIFKTIKNDGYDKAIFIGMGSKLSSTIANASVAEKYGLEVHIIDSLTVTILEGMLVIYANDLLKAGYSLDETVTKVKKAAGNSIAYGWVDTLKYLKAGGRLGKAASKASSLLNLKPFLSINGKGDFDLYKLKSSREKSYPEVEKKIREEIFPGDKYYMAYMYGSDKSILDPIKSELTDIEDKAIDIIEVQAGPVVAVHVGTKVYAVAYLKVD